MKVTSYNLRHARLLLPSSWSSSSNQSTRAPKEPALSCNQPPGPRRLQRDPDHQLLAQHVLGDEEHVGGALGKAPHEVRVPFLAEGNIDAHVVAIADQLALQVAANPVEHLELEAAAIDSVLAGEALGLGNHGLVLGGQPVEDGAVKQHATEADEVSIHIGLAWKRHLGRLVVSSLAQPHPNVVGDELLDIGLRAIEVGLDHDADH